MTLRSKQPSTATPTTGRGTEEDEGGASCEGRTPSNGVDGETHTRQRGWEDIIIVRSVGWIALSQDWP